MANAEIVSWRNAANSGDLGLKVNASDLLEFNGASIQGSISVTDTATIDLTFAANSLSADIIAGSITNTMISASAAIAFSKLASLSSANILVGSAGNVATSVAVTGDVTISNAGVTAVGTNKITNAMLAQMATLTIKGNSSGGTANASDLTVATVTSMLNAFVGDSGAGGTKGLVPAPSIGDAARFLAGDGTWSVPSGSGDVVGPASSTNNGFVRFDGTSGKLLKDSPASITNADIVAAAGIALNKLAATTVSRALVSDGSGFIAAATTTATEIGYLNGVTSAIQTQMNTKITNPMTTGGDVIYGGASGVPTRLANGSAGQVFTSGGTTVPPTWTTPVAAYTAPTIQKFTSGSGTYTTPTSPRTPLYIRVRMVGGGGGGSGSANNGGGPGIGGTGGNSTFGTTLLVANGGLGGGSTSSSQATPGGSGSLGTGPVGLALSGASGQAGGGVGTTNFSTAGGAGGCSFFGGNGSGSSNSNGIAAATNSGSGGGGGNYSSSGSLGFAGAGGGAGGFVDAIITSPSATYAYGVGVSGTAGTAGTGGVAGGAGGAGLIEVTEYYQ